MSREQQEYDAQSGSGVIIGLGCLGGIVGAMLRAVLPWDSNIPVLQLFSPLDYSAYALYGVLGFVVGVVAGWLVSALIWLMSYRRDRRMARLPMYPTSATRPRGSWRCTVKSH